MPDRKDKRLEIPLCCAECMEDGYQNAYLLPEELEAHFEMVHKGNRLEVIHA